MGQCGLLALIDREKAVPIQCQTDRLQAKPHGVGPPSHRHQDSVEALGRRRLALKDNLYASRSGGDPGHFSLGADSIFLLQFQEERLDQIAVCGRDNLRQHLDDGDLGTERIVDLGHLQTDDAAADDQQPLWHRGQG